MKNLTCLFLMCVVSGLSADEGRPLSSINLNLLGDGSYFSMNYDQLLPVNKKMHLSLKAGIGYNERAQLFKSNLGHYLTLTHHLTANFGSRRTLFEAGLGATAYFRNNDNRYIPYPVIGVRFSPIKSSGLVIRPCLHIPFKLPLEQLFFSPVSLSLGYAF